MSASAAATPRRRRGSRRPKRATQIGYQEYADVGNLSHIALSMMERGTPQGHFDLYADLLHITRFGMIPDVGFDFTGAYGVTADLVLPQFQGHHFHERHLRRPGTAVRVGSMIGEGACAVDTTGDDDASARSAFEIRHREMNRELRSGQVDLQCPRSLLQREFLDRCPTHR